MAIDWDREVLAPTMAVFGEDQPVLFTYRGGMTVALPDAVFDSAYREVVDLEDGGQSNTIRPCLGVRAALFLERAPKQNDTVYIASAGKTYVVTDPQPDGHGHIKLMLQEAA